jgi:hypothetical protein
LGQFSWLALADVPAAQLRVEPGRSFLDASVQLHAHAGKGLADLDVEWRCSGARLAIMPYVNTKPIASSPDFCYQAHATPNAP